MALTRRQRRIALIAAVVAVMAFGCVWSLPPAHSDKFYAFLEQHPWICRGVRIGFVLAGKEDQFHRAIVRAFIDRMVIEGHVTFLEPVQFELPPEEQQHGRHDEQADSPPPPPVVAEQDYLEPGRYFD